MQVAKIVSIGGGPAGLYSAILMKRANPACDVVVLERNQPDDTFGFGVVFSDKTMGNLAEADPPSYDAITRQFAHWDDIDIHYGGQVLRSTGHGFAGLGRMELLHILQDRCRELGVDLRFGVEVEDPRAWADQADLVLGADGVNSRVREVYADTFHPEIDWRPNRFVWLGTSFPFEAFTFYFKQNEHGMWRVHAYRYAPGASTFIVECTEATWRAAGMDRASEDETVAYLEALFADELARHPLRKNRSLWRQFPTIRNERWSAGNVVLLGDAVHTAHFSIGSGTKLALEDAIALRDALASENSVAAALARYERDRRREVETLQRAAQVSLEWFENTERYMDMAPEQFAFSLLTRSMRVTHANLKLRDEALMQRVDTWFAGAAAEPAPPPTFTPLALRGITLRNRVVVSPMCQYSATGGVVGDWHLVHLGSRAIGGAGLVMCEMTAVSETARISLGCAGMYTDEQQRAWARIVDFVHAYSDAAIGLQLGHAGRKGATKRMWEGDNEPLETGGWPLMAASALPWSPRHQTPREMARADMHRVRDDHVAAATRADAAGFDVLELHFAHGYLVASFISPLTNQRTDGYGGSIEGRMRYPLEIVSAVRAVWPEHKPLSVRISATDWADGGLSETDLVTAALLLRDHGCDVIDVSAGQTVPHQQPRYGRLFQTPFSELVRLSAGVPTITVGNVTSFEDIDTILAAGRADLVALARGHLYDPYLTRHAARAVALDLPWPPQYAPAARYTPRW